MTPQDPPAPGPEALAIGSVLLRFRGDRRPGEGEALVDLETFGGDGLDGPFLPAGALLAVQALHPLADVDPAERSGWRILAWGPGAGLAGLTARALGAGPVHVLPGEEEAALLRRHPGAAGLHIHAGWEELPRGLAVHRALQGCGGIEPDLETTRTLGRFLRPEGQIVLFGFPAASLEPLLERLGGASFSLRGAGFRDGLAWLGGTPLSPRRFLR